jgi:uncharacterized protein YecE (DUF72 family)
MARAFIGTSGWNYDAWKDDFYEDVPRSAWLSHCGESFTGLEVNATFYRLQERSTFEKWRDAVPEDFTFAVKANRYLTHNKKLAGPVEPLRNERERASALGEKLGAVLWQLPDWWGRDLGRLREFAAAAAEEWPVRHALEPRDPSWFDDEVAGVLREHGHAVCLSSRSGSLTVSAFLTRFPCARWSRFETACCETRSRRANSSWVASRGTS